ncbi:MAG: anaerobic ribonucleoside-triphosphate reductase [Ruminococcus sp.]|nr:anaerobic ribonucleoside-triphosphate reductase [Ruminococcus sp.]
MSNVCKSCGKYYEGDYCTHCGYGNKDIKTKAAEKYKKTTKPVRFMNDEEKKEYYDRQREKLSEKEAKAKNPKSNRNLLIFIAVAAVAVIAAGLISSGVISFGDKTDVIEDYFEAITERDFDKYVNCFPSEMKKDYENDRNELNCSKDEYMEQFVSVFEDDYGDSFSVSVKCGKATKLENYSMEQYEETYGSVPKISEAYVVAVTVTLSGSEKTNDEQFNCYVGKVRGKWKLFNLEYTAGTITSEMQNDSSKQ